MDILIVDEHDEVGPFVARSGRPVLHQPADLNPLTETARAVAEQSA